jgi:uncharacterized repeat protein (TIGR01451 family)
LVVSNTGNTWVQDPTVVDYVDTSMWEGFAVADNPAGSVTVGDVSLGYSWAADGANGVLSLSGTVAPGAVFTVPVTLTVAGDADPKVLVNTAEISSETAVDENGDPVVDGNGDPIVDWDSVPDTTNTDPVAEDDHDSVPVVWYDVGVEKTVNFGAVTTELPLHAGSTVTFDVAVTNHGNTRAKDVVLTDRVDTAMFEAFDPSLNVAGTTTGDRELPFTWAADAPNGVVTLTGILEPGETVHLPVTLTVAPGAESTDLVNVVEVTGGTPVDPDGNEIIDPETGEPLPDSDPDNNTDDAEVPPRPVYDLSLEKSVEAANNTLPIAPGGKVTYTITVTNEGSVKAADIEVTDYLPPQLVLDDPSWTDNQDGTASKPLGADLEPGESASVLITFTVPADLAERVVNVAEISEGTPVGPDGKPIIDTTTGKPILDEDSTPDRDSGNDAEDEDDIDSEEFAAEHYDLALEKVVTAGTQPVLEKGDTLTYELIVTNEGTLPVTGFTIVDTMPPGMELSKNDANGWVDLGGGAHQLEVTAELAPGESYVAKLDATVLVSGPKSLTNTAEITELLGPDGTPVSDYDEETGDMISDATVQVGAPEIPGSLAETDTRNPSTKPGSPDMAKTGAQVAGLLLLASGAVAGGLLLMRRRRRTD